MTRKSTKGKPGGDAAPVSSRTEGLPERWSASGRRSWYRAYVSDHNFDTVPASSIPIDGLGPKRLRILGRPRVSARSRTVPCTSFTFGANN
jgi:hypothetical protein